MARMPQRRLAPLLLAIALAGCDGVGVVRTDDGRWLGSSGENVRDQAESTIIADVDRELGAHWRCEVALEPLPYRDTDDWRWQRLTAKVELIGDGAAPPPLADEEVRAGVARYLRPKVDNPTRNLSVTVVEVTDAARLRALVTARAKVAKPGRDATTVSAPASATAPAAAPVDEAKRPAAGASTYVVQAGDTLALISTAFYGTPQHWRRIADANPSLDPAQLAPGTALTIPPAP